MALWELSCWLVCRPLLWWPESMHRLSAYGIGVDVPSGWEAELSLQEDPGQIQNDPVPTSRSLVVFHAANFWLPNERDDYGSEALDVMGPAGAFIALVEFDSSAAESLLFERHGVPADLKPDDFDPAQLRRPMRGQAGLQRFFQSAGRAFCLHAVIGSYNRRSPLTREVNRILAGLTIQQDHPNQPGV